MNSQGTDKLVRKIGVSKIEEQFNPDFSNSNKVVRKIGGSKKRITQKKRGVLMKKDYISSIVNDGIGKVLCHSQKNLTSIKNIKST